MSAKKGTTRLVAWVTGTIVGILTIVLPLGYYVLARQYMLGSLEIEARLNARIITQIISVNPETWDSRHGLLAEFLARHPQHEVPETRRILNRRGEVVAESATELESPVVMRSSDLLDSGVVVGRIEIYRSLRPLLMRTGLLLIVVLPLGIGLFAILQLVPIRGMRRAEEIRQALYHASLEIQTPRPIRERLNRLLLTMRELLLLDGVAVLLADPAGAWLHVASALGTDEVSEGLRLPIGPEGGAIAKAYQSQKMIVCDGEAAVPEEFRLKSPHDQLAGLRARVFAVVPLVVEGRAIGVIGAHRKHSRRAFEPGTLELFQLFAGHTAPAIGQARLYEELRNSAAHLEAVVEDRTRELQRANARLRDATHRAEEASRRKSAFLADMSHEIRTPLNAVIGFSELLQGQGVGPLNGKQARYVSHILKSGKHLHQLIGDILDLSKVEAGKVVLQPQPLAVGATLEEVLVIVRGLANKKGQVVEADVESSLPILTADPVRFKQICFNLLSNAVKYTPENGRIRLVARRVNGASGTPVDSPGPRGDSKLPPPEAGDFLEIRVTDTGIGIKAENLPRLFQEFVRLEDKTGDGEEGTGLGLSLAKKLVDLHGGRIWAESEGEGRGSTFVVSLPFAGRQS
jgi:signal transduction histidine kinase